jgi:DhnA family fructose-bisphosphate aldolase class Ia
MTSGTDRRLDRIFARRPAIWLPVDDALLAGPSGHLGSPDQLLGRELLSGLDAVLAFRGFLEYGVARLSRVATIVNLSVSTVHGTHVDKTRAGTVEMAVRAGGDAVAVHVNLTAATENSMLRDLERTVEEAEVFGVPVVAIVYPRRLDPDTGLDDNYLTLRENEPAEYGALVAHCVRAGSELGASVVKTVYTGNENTFAAAVASGLGVPVVMAGGPPTSDGDAWARAEAGIGAGASAVAFGRQVFLHKNPLHFVSELRSRMDGRAAT